MKGFLRWMGGGSGELLAELPESEGLRLTATGATVLVVGSLATVSAALTAHQFLHLPTPVAVLVGVGWGAAICNLDRWLMLSIRRQRYRLGTLALAVPRVALAVVAGLVIAKPLVLIAFRDQVDTQATADKRTAKIDAEHRIDSKYGSRIRTLRTQIHNLQAQLTKTAGGDVVANDPIYRSASRRAKALQAQAQHAADRALCEYDGTCGTGHIGDGPVYEAKKAQAARLQAAADAAQRTADTRQRVLLARQKSATGRAHRYERAALATATRQLAGLRKDRAADDQAVKDAYKQPIGLADRLDALSEVGRTHPSVGGWSRTLMLLILLVDSAPALGKAMLLMGRRTPYEQAQDEEEAAAARGAKARRRANVKAAKVAASEEVDQAVMHREQWKPEAQELVARAVKIQRAAAERYLDEWAQRTHHAVASWAQLGRALRAKHRDAPEDSVNGRGRASRSGGRRRR